MKSHYGTGSDLPLSLGSFELEKRLCENAPLSTLTLSAENDMLVGMRLRDQAFSPREIECSKGWGNDGRKFGS